MADIAIGTKLFHWLYGPLTVIEIRDDLITVSIDLPEGIHYKQGDYRNSVAEEIIKKFVLRDSLGTYLFQNSSKIVKSKNFSADQQHDYYTPDKYITLRHKEILLIQERFSKQFDMLNKYKGNHEVKLSEFSVVESKHREVLQELDNVNKQLTDLYNSEFEINKEIDEIKQNKTKSPRESKENLERLPVLEKQKNNYLGQISVNKNKLIVINSNLDNILMKRRKLEKQLDRITEILGQYKKATDNAKCQISTCLHEINEMEARLRIEG